MMNTIRCEYLHDPIESSRDSILLIPFLDRMDFRLPNNGRWIVEWNPLEGMLFVNLRFAYPPPMLPQETSLLFPTMKSIPFLFFRSLSLTAKNESHLNFNSHFSVLLRSQIIPMVEIISIMMPSVTFRFCGSRRLGSKMRELYKFNGSEINII